MDREKMGTGVSGGLSRRTFLKGASVVGAAALATGALAGCSSSASGGAVAAEGAADTATPWLNYTWMNREAVGEPEETYDADFIIVGGGGGGMAALLQADDLGLNAVLLEKKDRCGGTFAFPAVGFFPNNHYALEQGKYNDPNELIEDINYYNHYVISPRILKTFMNETAESLEWMENLGCQFAYLDPVPDAETPFSRGTTALYVGGTGDSGTGGGAAIIETLIGEAESRGLDIRTSTAAQELIQDENGAVTGVLATDADGRVIQFNAPAVLLSTGGWGSNPDMLRELGGVDPDRVISPGFEGRDGDGVYMAVKAGAAWARGNGTIMFYGPHLPGPIWGEALNNGVYQPTLWVDQNGERFMNEGNTNFAEVGSAIREAKKLFVIQTAADVDRIDAENGISGYNAQGGNEYPGGLYKDKLAAEVGNNEHIFVADTLEELAELAGLPADRFLATCERYNELVAAGEDEDFMKNPDYLTSLEKGPYYAFDCYNGFFTTVGGVNINDKIQAVDNDGNPIEGLYVGGCDTGALCGDTYDFTSAPGEQSSWAITSGRLAAKQVATKLGK